MNEPNFTGYATRANVKCADGRTILPNAFAHNDGARVPLVWQHGHNDAANVLGHVELFNREDGVFAHGFFNETESGTHARLSVENGDLDSLSIYANQLEENNGVVKHGNIREVSLVLSGANPEARIENVYLKHSGEVLDDEAVMFVGGSLAHEEDTDEDKETETTDTEDTSDDADETVQDVLDTLNEKQRNAVEFVIADLLDDGDDDEEEDEEDDEDNESDSSDDEVAQSAPEGEIMNVFEKTGDKVVKHDVLNQDDVKSIMHAAETEGSFMDAFRNNEKVINHVERYGIENLDLLFPDAKTISDEPDMIARETEWVQTVLSGTKKIPFTRIKSLSYDLTHDDARARGYITGNMKKEEYFGLAKRETTPTTIYKKQRLDRDDIIDVTTMDIVAWLWKEMRFMLNEEIAGAILFGDGREIDDEDKIQEDKIRPVATDHEFYTHKLELPVDFEPEQFIEEMIRVRKHYKGSGSPTLFISQDVLTDILLMKDVNGRYIYETEASIQSKLGVANIVKVEILDDYVERVPGLIGVLVNLSDYAVGTDRGGEITTFDDFDIDFNQYRYLIEGRMSGALTKPKSAVAIWETGTAPVNEEAAPHPLDHEQIYVDDPKDAKHHKQVRKSGNRQNESGSASTTGTTE